MPVRGATVRTAAARRRLVARERLVGRLRVPATTMPRLVLVSAPAGFGKTTLLTQWLSPSTASRRAESPRPQAIWLSLDTADDEARAFLAHLADALQVSSPETAGEVERLLLDGVGVPVEDVVAGLVGELDALPGPTVVVLDDYHVIDAPDVHAAVAFLLANLPPQVTLAMTTRADPPLPLARLRARGELLEIRAADLRFTAEEAGTFLNEVMGLALAPEQVAALESRTEGWAVGLQLAALSARGRDGRGEGSAQQTAAFIEAFTGSHRFVLDYLVEEVLDTLPVRLRTFLLDTSVLEELSGPLCDAVTGGEDGQGLLEELERRNVFLLPLDDERRWFRYHHLFADALRARARAADPDRVDRLHRAAADWHAGHGTLAVAVDHALAAGDAGHAADLVELALPGARRRREDVRLRTWLNALPDDVLSGRALLATQMVPARLSEGDLDGAERWLELGETALGRTEPAVPVRIPPGASAAEALAARDEELRALPAQAAVYHAAVSQGRGDVEGTLTHARRALDLAGPHDHVARSGGSGFLGLAAWASGDLVAAVDEFAVTVQSLRAAGNVTDELGTTVVLGDLWSARGRPDRARQLYVAALVRAQDRPVQVAVTGDLHVGLAAVLREQGELAAAGAHLESARALGARASLPENRYRWFTTTAGLLASSGDLDGAVAMLDRAEPAYRPGYLPDVRPVSARRAQVRIAQGRLDLAQQWAREHQVHVDDPPRFATEHEHLVLARLLVAQHLARAGAGTVEAAVDLLDRLVAAATAADRGGSVVEALVVRATAHRARGDVDAALEDLGCSLAAAVPAGYRRLFLDEGPVVRDLLRTAAARPGVAGAQEAAVLLQAVEVAWPTPSGRSAVPATGGPEALSTREVEVLVLLATDLTGPEIAEHLYLSINTFRTHTRHIFTKLDVTTRRAAVTRAATLGVLRSS